MGGHRGLEKQPDNRCLRLTSYNLPFPNDAPSVPQFSANVGITIGDWQDPLPEFCRLAHFLHGSVQASIALRQRCQNQIPDAEATQFPSGKAMAQEVSPHGLGIKECTQTLARIPNLWQVQQTTQLAAMSTIVGHAHDGSHLAGILA
jgi:hypothetical protein